MNIFKNQFLDTAYETAFPKTYLEPTTPPKDLFTLYSNLLQRYTIEDYSSFIATSATIQYDIISCKNKEFSDIYSEMKCNIYDKRWEML